MEGREKKAALRAKALPKVERSLSSVRWTELGVVDVIGSK